MTTATLLRTPLHSHHVLLNAKMVPFAGWEMPIQFTSILTEVRAVRKSIGVFDVSHMGRIEVTGPEAGAFLDRLLTADIASLDVGRARYSLVCNDAGGILDDVMAYHLAPERYLVVCNAANRDTIVPWFQRHATKGVTLKDVTLETGMIAVQGPRAVNLMSGISLPNALAGIKPFHVANSGVGGYPSWVARTGYTGEDGLEFLCPRSSAQPIWHQVLGSVVAPCGLGARDILRLEAGLLLHGHDMDSTTNPFEAGLDRFVKMDKPSLLGKDALERARAGLKRRLVGFRMKQRGSVPRAGSLALAGGREVGKVTSGAYSPTLDADIGLAYVPVEHASPGAPLTIDVRGKRLDAQVVPLPFYRRAK